MSAALSEAPTVSMLNEAEQSAPEGSDESRERE